MNLANRAPPDYHSGMEFDELTEAEKLFFKASQANVDPNVSDEEREALWEKFKEAARRETANSAAPHDAS